VNQLMDLTEKPCGYEPILERDPHYTVKLLWMRSGHRCSYQYREEKTRDRLLSIGDARCQLETSMAADTGDCSYLECTHPSVQLTTTDASEGDSTLSARLAEGRVCMARKMPRSMTGRDRRGRLAPQHRPDFLMTIYVIL
jgi:hypothetical protein